MPISCSSRYQICLTLSVPGARRLFKTKLLSGGIRSAPRGRKGRCARTAEDPVARREAAGEDRAAGWQPERLLYRQRIMDKAEKKRKTAAAGRGSAAPEPRRRVLTGCVRFFNTAFYAFVTSVFYNLQHKFRALQGGNPWSNQRADGSNADGSFFYC